MTVEQMLSQKIEQICGENESLRKEINELLDLKSQVDIKPVELCIEPDEVKKRYPIGSSMEILRCSAKFCFKSPYIWLVVKPSLANNLGGGALYETLEWCCDYMDSRENLPEDEVERNDTFVQMVIHILTLHMDAFTDIDFTFEIAEAIITRRTAFYERIAKQAQEIRQDTLEDIVANLAFEQQIEESIKSAGQEAKKKGKKNAKNNKPAN